MKSKATMVFVVLVMLLFSPSGGWELIYDESGTEVGYSVVQTDDGGYAVAGEASIPGGYGGADFYLVKVSSDGEVLWSRTYGGECNDKGYHILKTEDGGFIIVGESHPCHPDSEYPYFSYIYVVKTTLSGDTVWTKTISETGKDVGYWIEPAVDGGYVIAGVSDNDDSLFTGDALLLKIDTYGNVIWTHSYGGSNREIANSVRQTADGGYIIAGFSSSPTDSGDIYLIKTDNEGNVIWERVYEDDYITIGNQVVQTSDGGYAVIGSTIPAEGAPGDVYLLKTDSEGNILWSRTYGDYSDDRGSSIDITSDGGFIITGLYGFDPFMVTGSVYLIRTNADGDVQWSKTFGAEGFGGEFRIGFSVSQTSDNGFIIAGARVMIFTPTGTDLYIAKTDSLGNISTSSDDSTHINNPPSFVECQSDTQICFGENFSTVVFAADPDSEYLTFDFVTAPEGAVLNPSPIPNSAWIQYTPETTGTFSFAISVCDPHSACDTCEFTLLVSPCDSDTIPTNQPPSFVICPADTRISEADSFTGQFYAEDPDGDPVIYNLIRAPEHATMDTSGEYGIIEYHPDTTGAFVFTISACDPSYLACDTCQFTLFVGSAGIDIEPKLQPQTITFEIHPNPFNSSCEIIAPEDAIVEIYNLTGELICVLGNTSSLSAAKTENLKR
ncbi:MAG TPA: hypothetical protein ENG11_05375 [candidate division Zixibacteria bacterium]|nr:hypothetical protein [candidate division Zixibacteria bacterium]